MTFFTFELRRDTATDWASKNPVLNPGEPGIEKDTHRLKVGDGASVWTSLPYVDSAALAAIAAEASRAMTAEGTLVPQSTTVAGISLSGNITAAALAAALDLPTDTEVAADLADPTSNVGAAAAALVAAETTRATTAESANSTASANEATARAAADTAEATTARAAEGALRNLTDSTFAANLSGTYVAIAGYTPVIITTRAAFAAITPDAATVYVVKEF